MLEHRKTGVRFENRKEARKIMGCKRYQKAVENGDFLFLNIEGNIISNKNR